MEWQGKFDWDAAEEAAQLRLEFEQPAPKLGWDLIDKAKLPSVPIMEGKQKRWVRQDRMKAVLRKIYAYYPDAHPSIPRLAREVGAGKKPIRRTIKALEQASLICVERRRKPGGGFANCYVIVWTELVLFVPEADRPQHAAHQSQHAAHLGPACGPRGPNKKKEPTKEQREEEEEVSSSSKKESTFHCATWDEAAALLARLGVVLITEAIDAVKARGGTPATVANACHRATRGLRHAETGATVARYTDEHRAGAIFHFLTKGHWPSPHPAFQSLERRRRRR